MKSRLKWLVLVLCLVMGFSALAIACGDSDEDKVKLSLDVTEITLYEGQSYNLAEHVTVSPADTKVEYESKDTLIATVGKNSGNINAVNKGANPATITVTAGSKTATVMVTVKKFDEPYVIVGDLSVANTVFKHSLWGSAIMITDDDFAHNDANELGDMLGARWFKAVQGQAGVFSTTLDLYAGSEFKIRQLGKTWDGQLNYAGNANWKVNGEGIAEGTSDVANEPVYKDGKKKSEFVTWRDEEPKSQRGFKILVDGNYTFTVTNGTPTKVDFTYNNAIDPAPQPKNFTVTIEKEGAAEALYTKPIAENADLSYSTLLNLEENDVITIKYTGEGEKVEGTVNEVVKGIANLPAGLTQAADGKITCTAANMYTVALKLTVECKVESVSIAAGIPVEVMGHGNWKGEGWKDSESKVSATLESTTDKKVVKLALELAANDEFGIKLVITGIGQKGWAAGAAVATDVELPAGLTALNNGTGNFKATAAGTYEFTIEIAYDAVADAGNPLNAAKITAIEKK